MTKAFSDHFAAVAVDYARFRPSYPAALFEFLGVATRDHQLAWDCACGNGQATLGLAERYAKVLGSDASAAQIAEAPRHPKIEWKVGAAQSSGLPNASCNLVTVAQALHWLPLPEFF